MCQNASLLEITCHGAYRFYNLGLLNFTTDTVVRTKAETKARIFLLVDLKECFFGFRVGGWGKNALKMTS